MERKGLPGSQPPARPGAGWADTHLRQGLPASLPPPGLGCLGRQAHPRAPPTRGYLALTPEMLRGREQQGRLKDAERRAASAGGPVFPLIATPAAYQAPFLLAYLPTETLSPPPGTQLPTSLGSLLT